MENSETNKTLKRKLRNAIIIVFAFSIGIIVVDLLNVLFIHNPFREIILFNLFENDSLIQVRIWHALIFIANIGLILSILLFYLKEKISDRKKLVEIFDVSSVIWIFFTVFYLASIIICFPARVSGSSMEPNFYSKDILFVRKSNAKLERFDVVFINITSEKYIISDDYILKRIIGLPGDTVEVINNDLYINGEFIEEEFGLGSITDNFTYHKVCYWVDNPEYCENGVIPEGYYFVMGDNRSNSTDSRIIGLIEEEDIYGKISFNLSGVFR